ncbi:branched-chain amino acid ABC transporter permease [Nonomuraea sp. NPDC050556]|uniref:branched-chain amino acid ABC transporter permease n=1 Tax=Nonomuraea sp. NPDC050556 TaxID=3364369 RepID=UPI0037AACDE8
MSGYLASVLVSAGIMAILALSLNLVVGYAGQVSLAQGALFGVGAYTAAIASTRYGVAFPFDVVPAVLVTALVGTLIAVPALRVRHDFLVLTTMGVNFVVVGLFQFVPYFGGSQGIVGIPLLPFSAVETMWLVLFCLVVTLATQWLLLRTWFGLRLTAIRDDEGAAAATGVGVAATKIWAFTFSGAYAGLAGCLYAHYIGSIFPGGFGFVQSVTILAMVILGGEGTLAGPVLAAVLLTVLPEQLRFVEEWRLVLYGALIVVIIRFMPAGLLGHGSPLRRLYGVARGRGADQEVRREPGAVGRLVHGRPSGDRGADRAERGG